MLGRSLQLRRITQLWWLIVIKSASFQGASHAGRGLSFSKLFHVSLRHDYVLCWLEFGASVQGFRRVDGPSPTDLCSQAMAG